MRCPGSKSVSGTTPICTADILSKRDLFVQNDEPTLLLYLLLLKSCSFRNYVFAATDIDQLVLPILQVSSFNYFM